MMKKVLLLLMVLVGYSAFFGTEANAKSISANTGLTKARIYINPGHGSWGGEDRHMGTVGHGGPTYTDTCGFFESNTNLEKGFGMLEKLIEYGVPFDRNKNKSNSNKARLGAALDLSQTNIVMSRVKNGPYPHDGSTYNAYSRNLSEIAAECESWNADVMISIHSNAITEGTNTNYPLFLYRGYTGSNQNGGSQAIASACWSYVWENTHMMWTYYSATNKNIQGDWTFASQWGTDGYGVLRHSVPGFLVEGYFHTYQPARHKAMNWDVCRIEGAGYAKGFRDYFGAGNAVGTGDIYGILRDGENTFSHTYYTPNMNTDDKYKPINNATVQLKKTDGTVVQTYKTDDEYNGAFVFNKVAPGTYNIVCSHPDYADVTTSVTVTADKVVYPSVKMTQGEQIPVQGHYAYDLSMTQSGDDYTLKFKSTGAVDKGYIIFTNKSTGAKQSISIGKVVAGENSKTINAYDLGVTAAFSWAVALDNPRSSGIQLIKEDNSIIYTHSSGYMARIGLAIDKDPESANFGKIYTITSMGKGLQKFNPDLSKDGSWLITGKFGQDLSTSTSANKYVRSNRLEIYKGKVYIANYASDYTGIWEYDPVAGSEPTNLSGTTYYERGVAFYGEGSNRKVFSLHENNVQRFDIGTSNTWTSGSPTKEHTAAGVLDNGDGDIIVTDNAVIAAQTRYAGNNVSVNPAFVVFDHDLNLICKSDNLSSTLNGSENGGMALSADKSTFAIVNSYNGSGNNGVRIQVYSVTWNGSTPSFSHLYEIPLEGTYRVDQMDFDYAGNLYIASQQKGLLVYAIKCDARTTTTAAKSSLVVSGKVVPGVEGHFAYDLEMEETDYSYILKFKSTGAVESAKIVFEETENTKTTNISEKEIGAVVKGDNSIELIKEELPYGTQTWAVVFENAVSESVELMKTDNSVAFENKAQGGVAIDKDTESANFGKIYTVTAYAKGLQAFDAEMNPVGDRLFTGDPFGDSWYSPYRVEANSGKLYITDWIDDRSGVYVYDPNAETPSAPNMFKGDRKDISDDDKGLLVNEENVTVGCNVSSVEFVGEGENRKMYAFAEDAVNGAPRSSLLRYDLGTADTWAVAPSAVFSSMSSLLSTKDVVLLATDGGIFCAQKSEASNTAEKPAFVYVDFVGNIVFNSSVLTDLNGSKSGAIAMFGNNFAIANADGNIEVYKVAWNENVPSFSNKYTIKLNNTTEITQMEFDIAGNLYAFSVQEGLMKFAIKNEARATRTDAKAELQLVSSILTAIESVEVAAPVEYYNLQGIKVENPSNGVFIKLQGSKASKVVL